MDKFRCIKNNIIKSFIGAIVIILLGILALPFILEFEGHIEREEMHDNYTIVDDQVFIEVLDVLNQGGGSLYSGGSFTVHTIKDMTSGEIYTLQPRVFKDSKNREVVYAQGDVVKVDRRSFIDNVGKVKYREYKTLMQEKFTSDK